MAQVVGSLPPTWEIQMESLAPGLGLAQPSLSQTFGE